MTFEVCLILRSMSHVLKEQHQRVISWWEREWNQREQRNRVTPILEAAETWLISKITTEKHFSSPLLSSSHRLPEAGEGTEWGFPNFQHVFFFPHLLKASSTGHYCRLDTQTYPPCLPLRPALGKGTWGSSNQNVLSFTPGRFKNLSAAILYTWTSPAVCSVLSVT